MVVVGGKWLAPEWLVIGDW